MNIKNTIRCTLLLLFGGLESYAQSNPKPAGAYINAGAGWTPLLGTATAGAITYNPVPTALFIYNTSLAKWVPWDGSSSGAPPSGACGGDLGGTFPNCTVVGSHIVSGTAGFTGPVSITSTATSGNLLFINTSSLFGSAVAPVLLQGNASSGPAFGFTNTTYGANNKTWDIYQNPTSFNFRTSDDANSSNVTWLSAVRSGNAITGVTSSSGSGTWAHTGSFTTTGNITAQGTVNSTANTSPASIINSGVALSASPTVADVVYYDASRTTNNHVADALWLSGSYSLRFKSDDQASATTFFAAAGGQASGITGITSSSGTGTWTHTGPFTATGNITAPSFIGNASSATNLPGGLLGSMPYQSAASTTAMLAGSTSSAIAVLTQQGNGTISAIPAWNAATGTGLVVFATSPTIATPTLTGTTNSGPITANGALTTNLSLVSTRATGTAPLTVTSVTPVANMVVAKHPTALYCGTAAACTATAALNSQMVYGSATLTTGAVTVTGISPAFADTAYICTVTSKTTSSAAIFNVQNVSTSSFTINGSGSAGDVVGYICVR